MANQILTPVKITKEALSLLHNNLVFIKGADRQYSDEFARTGAKIGNSINIRKPNKYYVRRGPQMQTQNTREEFIPFELTTQWGVDISFSSAELTLSLDNFSERILKPAMSKLAAEMDRDGLLEVLNLNAQVGTPGTTPGSTGGVAGTWTDSSCPRVFLNAGVAMNIMAIPNDDNRRIILNPAAEANSVASLTQLFNPSREISEQYRKGTMGYAMGFEFAMDQNVIMLTNGTHGGTPLVNGAGQTGSSLVTNGWTASQTVLRRGEVFSIAGVFSVNPENQQNTGFLAQFVCTADVVADSSGNAVIPIFPSIVLTGAKVANGTVTTSPAHGAALTLLSGAASTSYPLNLAYHKDAFTLGTADLEVPKGVDFAARQSYDGISMRIVRAFDINSDQFPCRIDVLGGWGTIRPDFGVRIVG